MQGDLCKSCVLYANNAASGFFASDGEGRSGVLIVAEALEKEDAKQFKALVGSAGFVMGRAFSRKSWNRDEFRYALTLSCHPTRGVRAKSGYYLPMIQDAIHHCGYLDREIDTMKPKAIVALGETAFERLTGETLPMAAARGYVFPEKRGRAWVIPTFHPEFLRKGNAHLTQCLIWDVEKARRVASEGFEYDNPRCLNDPTMPEWEDFVRRGIDALKAGAPLALDIETPYKSKHADDEDELDADEDIDSRNVATGSNIQIDRISFAFAGNEGASVLWQMPYLVGVRTLIEIAITHSLITIWNRSFDSPRVAKALELQIPITRTRDALDAWHVLYNALPRKLGFATACLPSSWRLKAWKHLASTEPAYYSTVDAIALWRNDQDIQRLLEKTGQLGVYNTVCRDLDPALEFMSAQGLMVDVAAKEALRVDLEREMVRLRGEMEEAVPLKLRKTKEWASRKAADKGLALLKEHGEVALDAELFEVPTTVTLQTCTACGERPVTQAHVKPKTLKAPTLAEEEVA